jgi:DNA invertase Pin-like site-specific DNA recombinase
MSTDKRQADTKKITILYERLSREDGDDVTSLSITNQQKILQDYAEANGLTPYEHRFDDGKTGTTFARSGWQSLMADVDAGRVSCIVFKNLDRMGRDYLRVGLYLEQFKELGIRVICVGDNIDTSRGDDDLVPFRALFAEWYSRDCSRKIKAVAHSKGNAGKPLSYNAIYGYVKDPTDKNRWLVDDEAAAVVRRIFQMAADGMGAYQIARKLAADKVEKPSAYFARAKGWSMDGKNGEPYAWNGGTVGNILSKPEYCGHTVNFRTYKESYKGKKFKYNDKSDWKIFEGTHDAIISQEQFDIVRRLRGTPRRPNDCGEANPLTGLLFCHECGRKMYNSRQAKTHYEEHRLGKVYRHKAADFYTCSTNSLARGVFAEKCSQHYIRTEVVREIVLATIKATTAYVRENEADFAVKIREMSTVRQAEAAKAHKKQLTANEKRVAELDRLFKKTYEDNANGKLSDKRFAQLSADYEMEQADLQARNVTLAAELAAFDADTLKADRFIELARRYTAFDELTPRMLNEFVNRVEVWEAEKIDGRRTQRVDVYLSYIGRFELPAEEKAPPTPEETAAEEKRKAKLARQREANRRWYAKKRAEQLAAEAVTEQTATA